ncbi:CO/xanthine dehydrogenase Mo-binding subunit [Bradyrhizobium sp. GM0.4]
MNKHVNNVAPEATDLSRRSFLVGTAAAGLVLGYAGVPGIGEALAAPSNFEPSVWYAIAPDGLVTVTCGKADMGQHIASTMAQIVAEELGAKWSDMRVQLASNDPKFNDPVLGAQITGGSWSTMMNFEAMSRAGAAGRMALTEGAAAAMGVPASELVVRDSMISHPKSKKAMSFADVVKSGKATKTFTPDELKAIKLKTPDQYTMIGVSVPQLDIPSKTNGTAKYGIDVMLLGMAYGAVVTPPVRFGATVKSVDDSAAKKVPGFIKAVTLDDKTGTTSGWVVAVAGTYANAKKAAQALKIAYDGGPNAKVSSQSLLDEAMRLQKQEDSGQFFVKDGDPAAAFGTAAKVLEAEYTTSINIHAPMEPMNATAEFKGEILHIYSGNQFATRSGAIAAGAAGIDPKFVVMHQMWLGGGFGRRLDADMMIPAVQAAKAIGKPVKVIYTRENDMTMGFLASAHLPESEGRRGRRRQAHRAQPRRGFGVADPALGNTRFPDALGRQEGSARLLHGERGRLLLHRAQPSCARDQERDGAQRDAVRPAPLGRAGLDLLGGRKHDRRDRGGGGQGPRAVPHLAARRRRQERRRCAAAAQYAARRDGSCRLRHQEAAER